jgi:hypothetical protein
MQPQTTKLNSVLHIYAFEIGVYATGSIDNCCHIRSKILVVFPLLKVLLDIHHFVMRYVRIFSVKYGILTDLDMQL